VFFALKKSEISAQAHFPYMVYIILITCKTYKKVQKCFAQALKLWELQQKTRVIIKKRETFIKHILSRGIIVNLR